MVHEAMVLEYSGRHLAVIELAAALKLLLYVSLIACVFVPWGMAAAGDGAARLRSSASPPTLAKLARRRRPARRVRDRRSPRCGCSASPTSSARALMLGLLGTLLLFVSRSL